MSCRSERASTSLIKCRVVLFVRAATSVVVGLYDGIGHGDRPMLPGSRTKRNTYGCRARWMYHAVRSPLGDRDSARLTWKGSW